MGSFIGHAITGSCFWLGGFLLLLRAMGLRFIDPLRYTDWGTTLPGLAGFIGGPIYSLGEIIRTNEFGRANIQHHEMAATFFLGGLAYLLHSRGYLKGLGWALIYPICWGIVGLEFNLHPQHGNMYAAFGHVAMGICFLLVTCLQIAELMIGHFATNPRLSEFANGKVLPMYKNPKIYGTPIPTTIGLILMITGSFDWDMAMNFLHDNDSATWMEAEMNFIMHVLINVTFALVITLILQQIDRCWKNRRGKISTYIHDDKIWGNNTKIKADKETSVSRALEII